MNDNRPVAAIGGLSFVAAWIGFGFGDALLCLLGAAVAWVVVGVLEGKIDLVALQSRLSQEEAPPPPPHRRCAPRPRGPPDVPGSSSRLPSALPFRQSIGKRNAWLQIQKADR